MTTFDLCYVVFAVIGSLIAAFSSTRITLFGSILLFLCYAAIFLGIGAFFFHWPQKIRQNKNEKRLLSLPKNKVNGTVCMRSWQKSGKSETVSSLAGYSIGINGNFASHYKFESDELFDGASITVEDAATGHWLIIRSFKRDYSSTNGGFRRLVKDLDEIGFPTLQDVDRSFCITYVTDSDGTNYFVRAKQI